MGFDFNYMLNLMPILLKYLGTTMEMVTWGLVFSLILAVILANIRVFRVPVLDQLSQLYISFFRGTPLLVQLFLLYYGLPQIFPFLVGLDAFGAAVIGLTLHFAAYMAESIRAAIIGIDRSQMEASLSVGMTTTQAMRRVILPQATRVALPSLMNYFIDMINLSSLYARCARDNGKSADGSFFKFPLFRGLPCSRFDLLGRCSNTDSCANLGRS